MTTRAPLITIGSVDGFFDGWLPPSPDTVTQRKRAIRAEYAALDLTVESCWRAGTFPEPQYRAWHVFSAGLLVWLDEDVGWTNSTDQNANATYYETELAKWRTQISASCTPPNPTPTPTPDPSPPAPPSPSNNVPSDPTDPISGITKIVKLVMLGAAFIVPVYLFATMTRTAGQVGEAYLMGRARRR